MQSQDRAIEIEVVVGQRRLEEFVRGDQIFVRGKNGREFTLRVANNDTRKIEVVVFVDEEQIKNHDSPFLNDEGYVIEPQCKLGIRNFDGHDGKKKRLKFSRKTEIDDSNLEPRGKITIIIFYEKNGFTRFGMRKGIRLQSSHHRDRKENGSNGSGGYAKRVPSNTRPLFKSSHRGSRVSSNDQKGSNGNNHHLRGKNGNGNGNGNGTIKERSRSFIRDRESKTELTMYYVL